MADLTPIAAWTVADVQHFARRAGFGVTPERAAELAALDPVATIDGWIEGTVSAEVAAAGDTALFNAVWANRADPVTTGAVDAGTTAGAVNVPKAAAPHAYLVSGPEAWRNDFTAGQASWAFRMQYNPASFQERIALFWHNLFATGWHKVDNIALMLNQIDLFRTQGTGGFGDLLVAVSKDPAMSLWLDSVSNNASGSSVPNENYAREVMELYSLGVDNGYNQADITQLARALSGWSFVIPAAAKVVNPASPTSWKASSGTFTVYQGQTVAAGSLLWWGGTPSNGKVYYMHPNGSKSSEVNSISFLGGTFDITAGSGGQAPGENAVRSILTARATNCSDFLAQRFLIHFVSGTYAAADATDLSALIRANAFDLKATLKTLLKSKYFFDPANRFSLVEGPVSWAVRAARALGMDLAAGDAQSPKGFPAWRLVMPAFDQAGMKVLDPNGPNGWKEDVGWLNSNAMRYRTRLAAAIALAESTNTSYHNGGGNYVSETLVLFPSNVDQWFPTVPASGLDVFNRLVNLLQPAPIPTSVRDGWLSALWPTAFAWSSAADKNKARELAYLILCSPSGQLY